MSDCLLHLVYTYHDDGVWLICDGCPWEKNLGFDPTVADVLEGQTEHAARATLDTGS